MTLLIGIPLETATGERRVATVPEVVEKLIKLGFPVAVQSGAGAGANFGDGDYGAAGAEVVATAAELRARSDIVFKVRPPSSEDLTIQSDRGVFPNLLSTIVAVPLNTFHGSSLSVSAFRLRCMRGEDVHQCRTEAVVGLQSVTAKSVADLGHRGRRRSAFDHGRYESRETGTFRAAVGRKFGMYKVETKKGMLLVFDSAKEVCTAAGSRVPPDQSLLINSLEFFLTSGDVNLVAWDNTNHRENFTVRFPAFGAAAGMIENDLGVDLDFNGILNAQATQLAACETFRAFLDTFVDCWVDCYGHVLAALRVQ
ncbi:hypothetical protein OKW42_002819 [Paraburkholderia sp. WC7.3d]